MFLLHTRLGKAIALFTATLLTIVLLGTLTQEKAFTNPAPESITMAGVLRDFQDTHPDFERTSGEDGFRYSLDHEIVQDTLDTEGKPQYKNGSFSTTNKENFDQWYRNVAGINQSVNYSIELADSDGDGIYTYYNSSFFPLDNMAGFDDQGRNHNYHFTYEVHNSFTYQGGEHFEFRGDDDVWVYINGQKVIDLGGVHTEKVQTVNLDEIASSIGISPDNNYSFDLFFAERHTTQSNFKIETSIAFDPTPQEPELQLHAD